MSSASAARDKTILHAVVGYKLPTYFVNCVRSIRRAAPEDDLLIVDNDSQLPELTHELEQIAASDAQVRLVTRPNNDSSNDKVGGLYAAYREIVAYALESGYEFLHLLQGDTQMLWWDGAVLAEARRLFTQFPRCVQVFSCAFSVHHRLGDEFEFRDDGVVMVRKYGMCDMGICHLARWREYDISFRDREVEHGREYLERGFRVVCHPWPTVAQIPWPAVARRGRQLGQEVESRQEFLLKPLDAAAIDRVKHSPGPVWLEDICVPWDWMCLTPMWVTDLNSIHYWMYIYRDIKARGFGGIPRWERRGVVSPGRVDRCRRRPRLWDLAVRPPWAEVRRALASRRLSRRASYL